MISFCLIVKNEARWIADCIQAIAPLATEIIVADTGSNDGTLEILKGFPQVKIYSFPWTNHFGDARNFTIEKATQPWIFSFDADEAIALSDVKKFQAMIESIDRHPQVEAISLVRRDYVTNPTVSGFVPNVGQYPKEEEGSPGYYTERMIRIFRNRPHIRWIGSLHEMVDKSLKGQVHNSDLVFHHYGYMPSEVERKQKAHFYEEAGARKTKENPHDWKAHFDVAVEFVAASEFERSLPFFKNALELNGPRTLILSNWGYALMSLNQIPEAREKLRECVQLDPKHHDGILNLGTTFMRTKDWAHAIQCFSSLIKYYPNSFLTYRNLGLCYAHIEDLGRAEAAFSKAIALFPNYVEAKLDLATLRLQRKDLGGAMEIADDALKADPKNERGKAIKRYLDSEVASLSKDQKS